VAVICNAPLPVGANPVATARPAASVVTDNVRAPPNTARPLADAESHRSAGDRQIVLVAHFDDRGGRRLLLDDIDWPLTVEDDDLQGRLARCILRAR
jgi:hypothetical protein